MEIDRYKRQEIFFEKCDKEAAIYQIDFNPKEQRKSEYVQLFTDFGWEFVAEKDGRFYFSKPALQCSEEKYSVIVKRNSLCAERLSSANWFNLSL